MRILGKNCKNRLSVGGSDPPLHPSPQTPAFFPPNILAYYYNFVEFVSSAKCILFRTKKNQV